MRGQNDNTEDLKRERRSLLAKIERRETAILFARRDIWEFRDRLTTIQFQLEERKPGK